MGWMRAHRKGSCSALLTQFLATPLFSANLLMPMLHSELLVSHGVYHNDISGSHEY